MAHINLAQLVPELCNEEAYVCWWFSLIWPVRDKTEQYEKHGYTHYAADREYKPLILLFNAERAIEGITDYLQSHHAGGILPEWKDWVTGTKEKIVSFLLKQ